MTYSPLALDLLRNGYVKWGLLAGLLLLVLFIAQRGWHWLSTREDRELEAELKERILAGDLARAGEIQVQRGNLAEAARIFERAKEFGRAAEVHLLQGNNQKAAEGFAKAGEHVRAGLLFKKAGDFANAAQNLEKSERRQDRLLAGECYLNAKEFLRAGRIFQDCEAYERAADAFKNVEDLDSLDVALTMLENAALKADATARQSLWGRAAELATKLGAHERAAKAFDESRQLEKAAEVYEKALKQLDLAAALYAEAGDEANSKRVIQAGGVEGTVLDLRLRRARARGDTSLATQLELECSAIKPAPADAGTKVYADPKPETPSSLEGRFEVLGELGRGGMGVVHRAKDLRLGRPVALKFLPADGMDSPMLVRLFHREARAAAALSHPGIVTIYDVGTLGDREFIAMELVEGETLDAVLERSGPLSTDTLLDVAEKVFSAIEYAHSNNVIHRDIKPANLMRTKVSVKVMDFGLAKVVNSTTAVGHTVIGGTPNYMPPEQLTGQADHRSDIFALGATFYELVTGVLPGKPGTPAHRADSYPTPRERVPAIPARLSELLMQCLEHKPADRPQDLPAMLREIRAIQVERLTLKESPPKAQPVVPAVKPRAPAVRISREEEDDAPRKNIVDVVELPRKR